MARCVRDRFPSVYISVRSTNQSLSGFCVIMELHRDAFHYGTPMVLFGLALSLTGMIWLVTWKTTMH